MRLLKKMPRQLEMTTTPPTDLSDRDRLHAIYSLISSLSASLNYQRVLDSILDLSGQILATSNGAMDPLVSAVFLFAGDGKGGSHLVVGTARRFTPTDSRITLLGSEGIIHRV